MFTNGSTAMECAGGLKLATLAGDAAAVVGAATAGAPPSLVTVGTGWDAARCLEIQNLSMAK
jgi:hypothetical protein